MISRAVLVPALTVLALSLWSNAAAAAPDLAQEYDQVLKIAQRDPKVREAFDRAHERLQEKIVELDPALKGYTPRASAAAESSHAAPQPFHQSEPAPKPKAHVAPPVAHAAPAPAHVAPAHAAPAPAAASGQTHVVAPGETIASISSRYHVSAASVETANHITDPRKLQAGQTLVIPAGGHAAAPAHAAAPSAAPADAPSDGILDRLKRNF